MIIYGTIYHSRVPLQEYRTTLTTMGSYFRIYNPFIERVPRSGDARSSAVSLSPVTHHRYPAMHLMTFKSKKCTNTQ